MDPSSFGQCAVEEIPGHRPHGSDVLGVVKRYMADLEPYRVVSLVPAAVCCQLRAAFQQPTGVCDRRAISDKVFQNITTLAPQCARQKVINTDGLAYLTGFLNLRRYPIDLQCAGNAGWHPPARFRVVNLARHGGESDDDGDVVEGPVALDDDDR